MIRLLLAIVLANGIALSAHAGGTSLVGHNVSSWGKNFCHRVCNKEH